MGQLGHARAFHHADDGLDLLGLLRQLRTLIQFLGEVTRIRVTETLLESFCDQLGFLERGLAVERRPQLLDELPAFLTGSFRLVR